MKKIASVIGPSEISSGQYEKVKRIGQILAETGFVVATGGLYGTMEAALKGAKEKGGLTIGVIPHVEKKANSYVDICLNTGLGVFRNYLLVVIADVVICTGLSSGTWTELTMALRLGKRVIFTGRENIPFKDVTIIREVDELEGHIKTLI